MGKRGLHCLASCLAAAPLRGARCRPGSERVKAAGRDKGLGGGARLPCCLPQSLSGSVCLGGPGPGPEKPPNPETAASTPQLKATWAPRSPKSPQTEGHRALPPRAPGAGKRGRSSPSPPLLVGPHSRPPSSAVRPGTGAGSPGRCFQGTGKEEEPAGPTARPPYQTEPAPRPGRARPAAERPSPPPRTHRPPEPAPAGSRSGDAASSGPGRVQARAQLGAAQHRPPRSRERSRKGAPCWWLQG